MVLKAERLDPALLSQCESDEEAELDQLRNGEVLVEPFPEGVVGDLGIPNDGAGVGQRRLLARAELLRVGEVQQLVVFLLGESFPSSLDGALDASIFAVDGFGDVNAT